MLYKFIHFILSDSANSDIQKGKFSSLFLFSTDIVEYSTISDQICINLWFSKTTTGSSTQSKISLEI